jgi:glucan biosynthesis protein
MTRFASSWRQLFPRSRKGENAGALGARAFDQHRRSQAGVSSFKAFWIRNHANATSIVVHALLDGESTAAYRFT